MKILTSKPTQIMYFTLPLMDKRIPHCGNPLIPRTRPLEDNPKLQPALLILMWEDTITEQGLETTAFVLPYCLIV